MGGRLRRAGAKATRNGRDCIGFRRRRLCAFARWVLRPGACRALEASWEAAGPPLEALHACQRRHGLMMPFAHLHAIHRSAPRWRSAMRGRRELPCRAAIREPSLPCAGPPRRSVPAVAAAAGAPQHANALAARHRACWTRLCLTPLQNRQVRACGLGPLPRLRTRRCAQ